VAEADPDPKQIAEALVMTHEQDGIITQLGSLLDESNDVIEACLQSLYFPEMN